MASFRFISIDQNCLPLWDAVPKLLATARGGIAGTHCVEDIDVAFTRRGAAPGDVQVMLARERVYRDGTSDWGAALFYTEFLGRNPLDLRDIEPFTGMKTSSLARRLGMDVDTLYDRWAGSDNHQLIGSSYLDDRRVHRVIGDLRIREIWPHLTALYRIARNDLHRAFPSSAARRRIDGWFDAESAKLHRLQETLGDGPLSALYAVSLRETVPADVHVTSTSDVLYLDENAPDYRRIFLLFLQDYPGLSSLYNAAVSDAGVGVSPLRTSRGELPFYAVYRREGRLVRSEMSLEDGILRAGPLSWPAGPDAHPRLPERMRADGVIALAGKAVLLVIQARLRARADLLLPEHGSLYMPAAFLLERWMRERGLLPDGTPRVRRVRFAFLHRLGEIDEPMVLPDYVARVYGRRECSTREFAQDVDSLIRGASEQLRRLKNADERAALLDTLRPDLRDSIRELETRRRELVRDPARRAEAGLVWDEVRNLERMRLAAFVEHVIDLVHVSRLSVWNSRGALIPWAHALGGAQFVERVLDGAEFSIDDGTIP